MSFYGQGQKSWRQVIPDSEVPKKVREEFKKKYPSANVKMWFTTSITYWYQDYGPSYYSGWYSTRTVVVYNYSQPANFEVEFYNKGENSRAIFNKYGVWFETRTQVSEFPGEVQTAINNSDYADWRWSDHKERIEAPGMVGAVYRMNVTQRHLSNIIRINDDGKIIQVKKEEP